MGKVDNTSYLIKFGEVEKGEASLLGTEGETQKEGHPKKENHEVESSELQQIKSNSNMLEVEESQAFISRVQNNATNYKEAMLAEDKLEWEKAIRIELDSMEKNQFWTLVDRAKRLIDGKQPNIINSRWAPQRKIDDENKLSAKLHW